VGTFYPPNVGFTRSKHTHTHTHTYIHTQWFWCWVENVQ